MKFSPPSSLRLRRLLTTAALCILWSASAGSAAEESEAHGRAVDAQGDPLGDVRVCTSQDCACTDEEGRFSFRERPTAKLPHFFGKQGYVPRTLRSESDGTIQVVLKPSDVDALILPTCPEDFGRNRRRVELSPGGFALDVPSGARVRRVSDAHYFCVYVRPPVLGRGFMEWCGGAWWSFLPDPVASFPDGAEILSIREILPADYPGDAAACDDVHDLDGDFPMLSVEAHSVDSGGTFWGYFGGTGETLTYRAPTKRSKKLFDSILKSLCSPAGGP